ncbi:MAG: GNAT family N-acetyltransferase [Gammaproteobacteria bacterium]|nr:GNAT family N-acetyltransferase [Gammaproteobacteria bacterium]MBT3894364.1 GNAT family N-acetyltransferase [Gammaproteobacteria bacterium]MBT5688955.1 GNAT family N-acetyltransferase [Gammaproteobacteria bacterium]MBT6478839.1 GNAT family N-acetyltransferase [Gammaproteobacteria bacterium]MBT6651288.1 GNAT family N-acetyltransferase [Gammaproteobacteria bacterium]
MSTTTIQKVLLPATNENKPIEHHYMGYKAIVTNETEYQQQTHALRHKVYCEELKWVPENSSRLEFDEMDAISTHFAVINPENQVVACFRISDNRTKWLVERHFLHTLSRGVEQHKNLNTIEGTRLAIDPEYRVKDIHHGVSVLDMIISIMVDYTRNHMNKSNLLFTITPMLGILLKRRKMNLKQLGNIVTMEDGCKVVTYLGDLTQMSTDYPQYQTITLSRHY